MSELNKISIFEGLSEEEFATIDAIAVTRNYPKNSIIINEGDIANAMYMVTSGKVRVYVSDDQGKEFILNSMGPGEYFGELSLLDDEKRSASVITTEKSTFSIVYKEEFTKAVKDNPNLSMALLKNLAHSVRQLTDNIKTLALQDVYGRIRKTLIGMAIKEGDIMIVKEKLTQQDIANRIGSSREMVARILKDLTVGGYIRSESKQFHILKKLPESY
ncbi:MAG: Crp/Fnr family transcriptional regulator [Moraxellaceae bacterium]|nr:MAG: Crp/Fnr family transcriptional regulator [Moraxellaceae bacterium]